VNVRTQASSVPRVLYHGTSTIALPSIKQEGIIPHRGRGGDTWAEEHHWTSMANAAKGERANSVFLAKCADDAQKFALTAAQETDGKPVVLTVEIPPEEAAHLKFDEMFTSDQSHAPDALRFPKPIPPAWIKGESYDIGRSARDWFDTISLDAEIYNLLTSMRR
jgi:hypothetical protein